MTRLSAVDALGRGLANVRGNLAVVATAAAGALAVLVVILLAMLPWLGAMGIELSTLLGADRLDLGDWAALATAPAQLLAQLGTFLLSLSLALTFASVLFSWYHGGVLGVLAAGDAQAPAGAGRPAVAFRTWSWPFFAGEATRLTWRVLIFYSLLMLLWSVLAVAAGVLVFATTAVALRSGGVAGFGLGCGGALPLLFGFFVVFGATQLGQADLPRAESRATTAARAGFRVLGRRLGAALGLGALLFGAAFAIGIAFALVDLALVIGLGAWPAAAAAVRIALLLVQLLASSWLNLVFAAAFIALLRSERAIEAAAAA